MASLMDKIKAGAKIVDVRTPEEYESGYYPGAVNISVEQVQDRLEEFGPKEKPVIVYCETGARSAYVMTILKRAGYTDITNAGGLVDMPGYQG